MQVSERINYLSAKFLYKYSHFFANWLLKPTYPWQAYIIKRAAISTILKLSIAVIVFTSKDEIDFLFSPFAAYELLTTRQVIEDFITLLLIAPLIESLILVLMSEAIIFFVRSKFITCIAIGLIAALGHELVNGPSAWVVGSSFVFQAAAYFAWKPVGLGYRTCVYIHSLDNVIPWLMRFFY